MFFMWFANNVATCMYYTGIDPFTKKPVHIARGLHDRKLQRALMRPDLLGDGCDCLILPLPPKEALEALQADYYHAVPTPKKKAKPAANCGYRPGRTSQQRRAKPNRGPG